MDWVSVHMGEKKRSKKAPWSSHRHKEPIALIMLHIYQQQVS